jgi:hypothetical protein
MPSFGVLSGTEVAFGIQEGRKESVLGGLVIPCRVGFARSDTFFTRQLQGLDEFH